jgi:hypothetical protein
MTVACIGVNFDLTNGYFTLAPDFLDGSPLTVELDFGPDARRAH